MSSPRLRVTLVIMDVLDVIMSAPQDDLTWGLRICEATGYGSGTVYPALDRLMKAGWIEDHWEDPAPANRPRRRFYTITSVGRVGYAAEQEKRAVRGLARARTAGGIAWLLAEMMSARMNGACRRSTRLLLYLTAVRLVGEVF